MHLIQELLRYNTSVTCSKQLAQLVSSRVALMANKLTEHDYATQEFRPRLEI